MRPQTLVFPATERLITPRGLLRGEKGEKNRSESNGLAFFGPISSMADGKQMSMRRMVSIEHFRVHFM